MSACCATFWGSRLLKVGNWEARGFEICGRWWAHRRTSSIPDRTKLPRRRIRYLRGLKKERSHFLQAKHKPVVALLRDAHTSLVWQLSTNFNLMILGWMRLAIIACTIPRSTEARTAEKSAVAATCWMIVSIPSLVGPAASLALFQRGCTGVPKHEKGCKIHDNRPRGCSAVFRFFNLCCFGSTENWG